MNETISGQSLPFIEQMYARYIDDALDVPPDWRAYFDTFDDEQEPQARLTAVRGPTFGSSSLFDPGRKRERPTNGRNGSALYLGRPEDRHRLLTAVSLFREVPESELEHVAAIAKEVTKSDGEWVFATGDLGREMYVILKGTVLVQRDGRVIAELDVGETVGEMAVLDGLPRSADAVARGDVRLLQLSGEDLNELLDRRPTLGRGLIRMLSGRLRDSVARQDAIDQLIRAYRVRGHLFAHLSPLGPPTELHPELDPEYYGFSAADMGHTFSSRTIPGTTYMTLAEILAHMRNTYCKSTGAQYMHIDDLRIKDWLQARLEGPSQSLRLSRDDQIRILTKLTDAEIFEQFIHRKFLGAKRFSLEGGESLIPLLDQAIEESGRQDIDEIVIGMAHRGRLNVLANVMDKSARQIFREFDDNDPERMMGTGDVKYHLGYSSDRKTSCGKDVHLTLTFNPSHLECVGPVVLGRTRAKQDRHKDFERRRRMGIIIHGDAAFAGQGVVQEMLNMSELTGYATGGTLHIIVNNQIGFTTPPERSRSTQYATDVARMLQIPIFHVNGEEPEPVARVIKLALDFRQAFQKDVVIDMYCYRRYGHNETDEPMFTQPVLYKAIKKRKSVREGYLDSLLELGEVSREEADRIAVERRGHLESELTAARAQKTAALSPESGGGVWQEFATEPDQVDVDTSVDKDKLRRMLIAQTELPEDFKPHPKIKALLATRRAMAEGERPLDWAGGEALAYASLLVDGVRVRLSGQDAGRGTFSHRHAILYDYEDGHRYIPLRNLRGFPHASFEVWDSPLSETGVLGFEYGYSLDTPDGIVLWEAQFGDFVNVAQAIIDQFISSGEDKWARMSGLVMLLPHGYEGMGPEHSSARLERFLNLAAEDNIQVCNLTTPAQFFHAMRRQDIRARRKPLIIMSPKSLLRHPEAVSTMDELASGQFHPVFADPVEVDRSKVRRILLTSGKLYYELDAARRAQRIEDVAILRLEQYYPLRLDVLAALLDGYNAVAPIVWVQEEPHNMGAWPFLCTRVGSELLGRRLSSVCRPESASPATGSAKAHKIEQQRLIDWAFAH